MNRLALALLLVLAPSVAQANLPKEVGQRAMPGVVFLVAGDLKRGKLVPISSGSGTILTPDGAILTNHHVIYDKGRHRLYDFVAVGMLKAYDQSPELTCMATPRHALLDTDLDLAVVKCEEDLSGKPYRARGWPTIPVGGSNDLIPGSSEVFVIGYPGVGGPTIHVTRGTVSGFLGKDGGAGRFWIKTDAAIAHGNSGGSAIDEAGSLVGIPTAVFPGAADIGERVGLMRPIELAKPLIAKAEGWWPGTDPDAEPTETGPKPPIAAPTCAQAGGVTLAGHVYVSDNSAAIEGAYVVVLKPGLRRRDVKSDYANLDELALVYSVSDQDGAFTMPCPVPRDQVYTVLVLAKSFVELVGDGVLSTRNVPDRFEPWGGKIFLQKAD